MRKVLQKKSNYIDPSNITVLEAMDRLAEFPENYPLVKKLRAMALHITKGAEWKEKSLREVLENHFNNCYERYSSKMKDRDIYGEKFVFNKAVDYYVRTLARDDDSLTLARAIGSDIMFDLVVDERMDLDDMTDEVREYLFNSDIVINNSRKDNLRNLLLSSGYENPEAYIRARKEYFVVDNLSSVPEASQDDEMGED